MWAFARWRAYARWVAPAARARADADAGAQLLGAAVGAARARSELLRIWQDWRLLAAAEHCARVWSTVRRLSAAVARWGWRARAARRRAVAARKVELRPSLWRAWHAAATSDRAEAARRRLADLILCRRFLRRLKTAAWEGLLLRLQNDAAVTAAASAWLRRWARAAAAHAWEAAAFELEAAEHLGRWRLRRRLLRWRAGAARRLARATLPAVQFARRALHRWRLGAKSRRRTARLGRAGARAAAAARLGQWRLSTAGRRRRASATRLASACHLVQWLRRWDCAAAERRAALLGGAAALRRWQRAAGAAAARRARRVAARRLLRRWKSNATVYHPLSAWWRARLAVSARRRALSPSSSMPMLGTRRLP